MKYAVLYTDEKRRLLASQDVELLRRLFYGVLDREGLRAGEARALQWGGLDLVQGTIRLDDNKTDHPRD